MRAKLEKIKAEAEAELANVNNNYVADADLLMLGGSQV
jgi:hypothetical protein